MPKCKNTLQRLLFKLTGPPESIKSRLGFQRSLEKDLLSVAGIHKNVLLLVESKIITCRSAVQDCYQRLTRF